MPKYWGENYFAHGSFPEVGLKHFLITFVSLLSVYMTIRKMFYFGKATSCNLNGFEDNTFRGR